MLCCVSSSAQHTLDDKDAKFLAILAQVAAEEIDRERARDAERQAREARLDQALTGECLSIVFQPIVDLRTMTITGAEALSRFTIPPQSPAAWFADAARLGRTEELELVAIREALTSLAALPANVYLSLNASPSTLLSEELADLVTRDNGPRLQMEITEHSDVDVGDHDTLTAALQRLRAMGVRIALDDAGSGYAGLRQILLLKPDVIKLDLALVRDIDHDPARAALAGSLVDFAARVDSTLIAEGVETQAELDTLLALGIGSAQGYLLGRPAPLPLPAALAAPPPRD
jgi:EAL domain-containing protein (putative c-di-GMP-specific phosphodiesterase class I)